MLFKGLGVQKDTQTPYLLRPWSLGVSFRNETVQYSTCWNSISTIVCLTWVWHPAMGKSYYGTLWAKSTFCRVEEKVYVYIHIVVLLWCLPSLKGKRKRFVTEKWKKRLPNLSQADYSTSTCKRYPILWRNDRNSKIQNGMKKHVHFRVPFLPCRGHTTTKK